MRLFAFMLSDPCNENEVFDSADHFKAWSMSNDLTLYAFSLIDDVCDVPVMTDHLDEIVRIWAKVESGDKSYIKSPRPFLI